MITQIVTDELTPEFQSAVDRYVEETGALVWSWEQWSGMRELYWPEIDETLRPSA